MVSETTYVVGDYVAHPVRPEWGPGRVLEVSDKFVTVYFRDISGETAGAAVKKLGISKVTLIRIQGMNDLTLSNLPAFRNGRFEIEPPKRVTFGDGLAKFQSHFPAFFNDVRYVGDLKEGERAYKWEAHELYQATLGNGQIEDLLASGDVATARTRLLGVESRVNLLSTFEKVAFRNALQDDNILRQYLTALSALLSEEGLTKETCERYLAAVYDLPKTGQTDPVKWPVATLIPFLADPSRFMFLKPQATKDFAARIMFDLNYSASPNWLTYKRLLEMSEYLLGQLREYGARDFIDVQSFIFVVGGGWDAS
jgi:hypothetical protein